jgi:hypothetical protein
MARKTRTFPFRFYNHEPEEWGEGSQMWLLRFVEPVTAAQRVALGQATGEAAFDGSFDAEDLWFGDGTWAALTTEDDREGAVFEAAGPFLQKLHALAPIAEVILATAKGVGTSAWDRWSATIEPLPSVFGGVIVPTGDHYVRLDAYYFGQQLGVADYNECCEAVEPVAVAEDQGFATAREQRFQELFVASREAALAKAKRSSKPALVPILAKLDFTESQRAETGRVVSLERNYPQHLVIRDPGAEARAVQPPLDVRGRFSLSPDGTWALHTVRQDLIELNLDDGTHRVVFTHELPPITAFSAGYCGSTDRVVASYGAHTLLLERSGPEERFAVVDTVEVDGVNITVLQGRYGFVKDSRKMQVVGIDGHELKHLGSLSLKLRVRFFEAELEGAPRIFARLGGLTYEVVNLDKAWDKAFKPKKKAASKKKAAGKRAPKKPRNLKLKLVDPTNAPDETRASLWQGLFEWASWLGETPSGRMVLRTRTGVAVVADGTTVREVDLTAGDGQLILMAQVHPTAERVLLAHGGARQLSELDLDTGELRVILDPAAIESRCGGKLRGAMIPADGWLVVMSLDKVTLHRLEGTKLSAPVFEMDTDRWDLWPIHQGRAAILTSNPDENQIIEVVVDEAGTPTGLGHVATLKMPGKKYSRHHADVLEEQGELFLFTDFGCFRAPPWE